MLSQHAEYNIYHNKASSLVWHQFRDHQLFAMCHVYYGLCDVLSNQCQSRQDPVFADQIESKSNVQQLGCRAPCMNARLMHII